MSQSTYLEIDACPARITALENGKADSTALTEETTARTTADAKHLAALVELVDGGAKNLLDWTATSSVMTITDNGDGTFTASGTPAAVQSIELMRIYNHAGEKFVLSGCPSGGSQSNGYSLLVANQAGSMIGADEGSGYAFTAPGNEDYFRVYVRFRPNQTYTNLLFKPMVCSEAAWSISHKFVPYCPTLPELYAMVQGGGTANSLRQTAQLTVNNTGTETEEETR